jgi:ribose 5-phosphate isomerase A
MDMDTLKKEAGYQAAELIEDGQRVGLGTGSTAFYTIERLAHRIRDEKISVEAVSTSFSTTLLCQEFGIPLLDLSNVDSLDIAIDGADEIDTHRNLIKGRGAAHVIEKIVAEMSAQFIVVADQSKKVDTLGAAFPVPVEVLPLARASVQKALLQIGAESVVVRMGSPAKDGPVISDSGNLILDARFAGISHPAELAEKINHIPGVLGHGIFANTCHKVFLATENGIQQF